MKTYFYKNCKIINVKNKKGIFYKSTYIITINSDIVGFSNTIKEAKKIIDEFNETIKGL